MAEYYPSEGIEQVLKNQSAYYNELDLSSFSAIFGNVSESYKFYWTEAILNQMAMFPDQREFSLSVLADQMIADAWYTVTEYHLRLGIVNSNAKSSDGGLERAVKDLQKAVEEAGIEVKSNAKKSEILDLLKEFGENPAVKKDKIRLTTMVPYRLLSPFTGSSALSGSQLQSFRKCNEIAATVRLPYTFVIRKGLETSILLDDAWSRMFADQCEILLGWIRYQKVRYLQNRNPGVPGIIYKLEPENAGIRKLQNARKLWTMVMDRREILDIYNGQRLNDIGFDLDHFVPWSYVASDELWDLLPMDSSLNSSKSNRLPVWDQYFRNYAENQFRMYETVFTDASVRSQFEKCRKDNLTSIWGAEELYIPNHNQTEFMNILEKNLRPVYDAAKQQGYGLWKRMNAYSAAIQNASRCL